MTGVTGLHHVTCIAGDAQDNVDFYSGVLGMRLVKKSVNQDSPGTYHLFYADGEGHPGTDITFFPWPEMPPAKPGVGLAMEVALAVHPIDRDLVAVLVAQRADVDVTRDASRLHLPARQKRMVPVLGVAMRHLDRIDSRPLTFVARSASGLLRRML